MTLSDREKIQQDILEALHTARKQVETLEAALAHNAAFLGDGIEREFRPGVSLPDRGGGRSDLFRYLELIEPEDDISNYIGRQGHEESRPRLGADAPASIRPRAEAEVSPRVGQVALDHPADSIIFGQALAAPESGSAACGDSPGQSLAAGTPPDDTAPSPGNPDTPPSYAVLSVPDFSKSDEGPEWHDLSEDACLCNCLAILASCGDLWDWDLRKGTVYLSPGWRRIMGLDKETGRRGGDPLALLLRGMHPDDHDNILTQFRCLLEGRADRVRIMVRFVLHEGWGWGLLRGAVFRVDGAAVRVTALLTDSTPWRKAELALRASDERFRALVEDLQDHLLRIDSKGRILYVSPNASRYIAEEDGDLVGTDLVDHDFSGPERRFSQIVSQVAATAMPAQAELLLRSPVRGKFVGDCRFWPEFDINGRVTAVSVIVRDIMLSRRLARNYYALFSQMGDGFVLFEHTAGWISAATYQADEFGVVVINPAFARMFGLPLKEAAGMRLGEVVAGGVAREWAVCLREVLESESFQEWFLSDPNARRDYEVSAYQPESGRVACIVRDVTTMKRAEKEIRLNETRFSALHHLSHMDAAPEDTMVRYCLEHAVTLTGSAFGFLYLASAGAEEQGRMYWSHDMPSREEKNGEPPLSASEICRSLHEAKMDNMVNDGFATVFGGKIQVQRYMLSPIREDGSIVCLAGVANKRTNYRPADLRQLELFLSGAWFHLRRRWSVQSLLQAKDEAEAANRAKNEFLANVSHELRTPLNGILGMLQLLRESPLTEEQQEYVITANASGRSLVRIISDILDFSRIEANRFGLNSQLFDLSATVRSALGMFILEADRKCLKFILNLNDNIPRLLLGDDARVRQILCNLVGNAFKFTHTGEVEVECQALPYSPQGKCAIYFSVRDTGIGIPDDRLSDVFTAFTQLDGSSTRRYSGTGLGLTIVQRLIQIMHGSLVVENPPGLGTTIHCSLFFDVPDKDVRKEPPECAAPPPDTARPLDVLVVEDDAVSLFTMQTILKRLGHTATCVDNGREAIEALHLRAFDCIITDIQMPVMDGMELTMRIREENTADIQPGPQTRSRLGLDLEEIASLRSIPRDIPIIALTAHAMLTDKERFLDMGMDYYMPKPLSSAELASLLEHLGTLISARESAS